MNSRRAISDWELIAQLREENLWLRAELGLLVDEEQLAEAKKWFGLTRSEATLLLCLVNSKLMTRDLALHALSRAGYDYEAQPKIVDVFICKLRNKLKKHGAAVASVWGTGYCLEPASRRLIAARLGQPITPAEGQPQ